MLEHPERKAMPQTTEIVATNGIQQLPKCYMTVEMLLPIEGTTFSSSLKTDGSIPAFCL